MENVFSAIEVEPEIIEKLSKQKFNYFSHKESAAITEENMVYFLGILE